MSLFADRKNTKIKKQENCLHDKCIPHYDPKDVQENNLNAVQVRHKYPRFDGYCPDCGQHIIMYASFEHYIAGDW